MNEISLYDHGGTVLLFSFIQKFKDSRKNIVESNCFRSIYVLANHVVLGFSFVSCKLNGVGDVHAFVI